MRWLSASWQRSMIGTGMVTCRSMRSMSIRFFVCDIIGGAPRPGLETSEVRFFTTDNLPSDLSVGRVRQHQITRMFEHW